MSSARVQGAIDRSGHVCNNRCVVRGSVERHYGQFGELLVASLGRREQAILLGWAVLITAAVAIEGWTLFR